MERLRLVTLGLLVAVTIGWAAASAQQPAGGGPPGTYTTSGLGTAGTGIVVPGGWVPALAGTYCWMVSYSGDSNNLTSTSPVLTQTVSAAPPPPSSPGQPIPTLSEWMLLLLAGLVGGLGFARLRSGRNGVQ